MTSHTVTKSLTIPAREVRPGDVLFGMNVTTAYPSPYDRVLWTLDFGSGVPAVFLHKDSHWPVERPVPSDPIGTVRAEVSGGGILLTVYRKINEKYWTEDGEHNESTDADVADFPILWKPGMPIPTEGVQA